MARAAWCNVLLLLGCAWAESAVKDAVSFYLYTTANPGQPQRLYSNDTATLAASNFNASLPTKIIIHGWSQSYKEIPNNELRAAYQSRGDYNIISVDWGSIAALNYLQAKMQVPSIGIKCAHFVRFLADQAAVDLSRLVVIGHSMGAHISGLCGKELQRLSAGGQRLGAIMALDPAFPLFIYALSSDRLAYTDADYVVTLHTNALFKGQLAPLGHAAFYANGGRWQPGCGLDFDGVCAHARCVYLYAEAVSGLSKYTPYGQCSDFMIMMLRNAHCSGPSSEHVQLGDPLEVAHVEGIYTFTTKAQSPFGHP